MLMNFEKWLRGLNESAADFLLEAIEEILILHRLRVPALPRKNLHLTNPTESTISTVGTSSDTTKAARCLNAALRLFACLHWEKGLGVSKDLLQSLMLEQGLKKNTLMTKN